MSKRKNLNDVIHGDRAAVRAAHVSTDQPPENWRDWLERKNARLGHVDRPTVTTATAIAIANDFIGGSQLIEAKKGSTALTKDVYSSGGYEKCYHKHKGLVIPGTDKVVYGGSCSRPIVKDADVYIGFDHSMASSATGWPWQKSYKAPEFEVCFPISDMQAPPDSGDFAGLVSWTKTQLDAGKKVHCGCIGGHGRTGTFLAALVSQYGEKDAITYVRKSYCDKAVETTAQVNFLTKNYGVTPVKTARYGSGSDYVPWKGDTAYAKASKLVYANPTEHVFTPVASAHTIWKAP